MNKANHKYRLMIGIIIAIVSGCFIIISSVIGSVGDLVVSIIKYEITKPSNELFVNPYLKYHAVLKYPHTGCLDGNIWAFSEKNKSISELGPGTPLPQMDKEEMVYVAPLNNSIQLEANIPENDVITVENIELVLTNFSPTKEDVTVLAKTSTCAGSFSADKVFYARVSPGSKRISFTRPRETSPNPLLFKLDNKNPVIFGIIINAVESGWYEMSVEVEYTYKGKSLISTLDKSIKMFVPDEVHVSTLYFTDWKNNDILAESDLEGKRLILEDMRTYRENWIVMELETLPNDPNVQNEYIRIINLGLERDIEGWTLKGHNNEFTYFFPKYVLGEWGIITVWSGFGVDSSTDLYVGQAKKIWTNTKKTNIITLYDSSGNEIASTSFVPLPSIP